MADPSIKELIEHGHTLAPAVAAAASAKTKPFPQIRIIESVVSALVIGGLTWAYQTMVAIPEIKREIAYIRADAQKDIGYMRVEISELKSQVEWLRERMMTRMER